MFTASIGYMYIILFSVLFSFFQTEIKNFSKLKMYFLLMKQIFVISLGGRILERVGRSKIRVPSMRHL